MSNLIMIMKQVQIATETKGLETLNDFLRNTICNENLSKSYFVLEI